MSDTDDTDVLLLIPPNLFLVPSDQESDSDIEKNNNNKTIVSNLISQINNLESRVNHIETLTSSISDRPSTEISDVSEYHFDNPDLSFVQALDSSSIVLPLKVIPAYTNTKNDLLGEVDQFLGNRYTTNTMEKLSSIDTLFYNGSPTKRLALPEVDKLLKEMESTQTEIENKLRMREIECGVIDKNKQSLELTSKKLYSLGDNIGSIPDRGFGIREMFANSTDNSPIKNSTNGVPSVEEPCVRRDAYLVGSSNSDDIRKSLNSLTLSRSPMKDFTSPTKVVSTLSQEPRRRSFISPRRRLQMNSDVSNGKSSTKSYTDRGLDFSEDRMKPETAGAGDTHELRFKPDGDYISKPKSFNNPRGNLLSLADLWRTENDLNTDDPYKLKQKLEEEKYRRLHLENTVQTLQRRVLEEQEKVAVAVKVDEGKDRAIGQVTEAWKQMVHHWRQIEAERHAMSQTLINERSEMAKQKDDIEKKIALWEKEMSQALDLAAGFKVKYEDLEKELLTVKEVSEHRTKELEETIIEKETEITELKEERKSLADRLQVSQTEHEEEKRLVDSLRRDVSMLQEQLSKCEAELTVVKEQRDLLSTRVKEERSRSSMLDAQKKALTEALDTTNDKLTKAEESLKATTTTLEKSKSDLRTVYQAQLEAVVRDKVAEFQSQLDRAQAVMQVEIENCKKHTEDLAQRQQQALVNSHVAEMRRLESIHKDELRTVESKLVESERRRARLENGKKDIAQRLHGVMESQWRQALNIITSDLSVKQNERGDGAGRLGVTTDDYISKLQQNLEMDDSTAANPPSDRRKFATKQAGNTLQQVAESETSDDTPFNRDGQITSRSNVAGIKQSHLLNYIQTLLERQPGKPVDTTLSSVSGSHWPDNLTDGTSTEDHSQHWAQVIQNNPTLLKEVSPENLKIQTSKKPPWKPT